MSIDYRYTALGWSSGLGLYLTILSVALAAFWFLFYKGGQLLLSFGGAWAPWLARGLGSRRRSAASREHELEPALAVVVGAWAVSTLTLALGLAGVFRPWAITGIAAAVAVGCRHRRIRLAPDLGWARGLWRAGARGHSRFLLLACGGFALLLGAIAAGMFQPWFDNIFTIAAGHLARTGAYLSSTSSGKPGIVGLVALVEAFFPSMSPQTAMVAWGPFFGPFLVAGMAMLIREACRKRFEALAVLIIALPIAFKAQEIRATVTGMGFVIWTLVFLLRHLRTGDPLDLVGAVFALAAEWNYGQIPYIFVFLGLWAAGAALAGEPARARAIWRVLLGASVIEWPHLLESFRWTMGARASAAQLALPGTLATLLALGLDRALAGLPRVRLPRWALAIPFLGLAAWAWLLNPQGEPSYNWYFFSRKAWFGFFNFGSYGLPGWLWLAALVVALPDALSRKPRPAASLIWLGFLASCTFQVLSPLLIRGGRFFDTVGLVWDLWKDTSLYWINPFMVLGAAYLVERAADLGWKLRPRRLELAAALAIVPCLQSWEPYRILLKGDGGLGKRWHDALVAQIAPHADHPYRAQQSYSLSMYLTFLFQPDHHLGGLSQLEGCPFCTIQSYGFMKPLWPLIDFMLQQPIRGGDTFVTSDSVIGGDEYFTRQVRYRGGANTVCPIYLAYLGSCTENMPYWKPHHYIRRNQQGMAYTILDPEARLSWLGPARSSGQELVADFQVSADGDYELYRGGVWKAEPAQARVDGQALADPGPGSPALGWIHLASGAHTASFAAAPGSPPLQAETPAVAYPRRYWDYEQHVLELHGVQVYGGLGLMRFTGVPSAEPAIEDVRELMTTQDSRVRRELLAAQRVRFVILDPVLRHVFPEADARLSAAPELARFDVNGIPVFVSRLEY